MSAPGFGSFGQTMNQTGYNPYGQPYDGSAFATAPLAGALVKPV